MTHPEGRLLITTPNITPWHRLRFLLGHSYQDDPATEYQKLESLGHMGHVRIYTPAEVRRLLEAAGLRVLGQGYLGSLTRPGTLKMRLLLKLTVPRATRDERREYQYAVAAAPE